MNWKLLLKSAERTNGFHQQDKLEMKPMKNTKDLPETTGRTMNRHLPLMPRKVSYEKPPKKKRGGR